MAIYLGNHIRSYLLLNSPQSYGVIIDIYVLGKCSITRNDIITSEAWQRNGNRKSDKQS